MRIMVIGQHSAGKTTFAQKLGKKMSLPVIHLDAIVNGQGRNKHAAGEIIRQEALKSDWIMDGNAFTSDRNIRLEKADYIFLLKSNPIKSLLRHIYRYMRHENSGDGRSESLHLGFVISFIFSRWPKREREIIAQATSLNKKVIVIKNFKEADTYLKGNL